VTDLVDISAAATFRFLRGIRTAGLRVSSPFESTYRRIRHAPELPPLWLRRHTGRVALFESAAAQTARLIRDGNHVRPGDLVLDLGCGPGAMAPFFGEMLGASGRYVGLDVHTASIQWCRRRFATDPRFEFHLADVRTPYSGRGLGDPSIYALPLPDQSVGFALAKSLFTHLLPAEARQYLGELQRVLKSGAHVFLTAFLYESGSVPAFPYGDETAGIRWVRRGRIQAAIAYEKETFLGMVADSGLQVRDFLPVFYPGSALKLTGQDILVLKRQ
jgi:SAM-dependent methyltransferase